jgi:hypothetical protein
VLKLRAYKSTVIHALQLSDPTSRVHSCSWFLHSVVESEIGQQLPFFFEEALFHLQGYIETQNNRYWTSQYPQLTHEVPLHPVKVGILCAVGSSRVVAPVLFNGTINYEKYVQVILGQSFPELTEVERLCGRFQQDSATAHTARISMQPLSDVFGDRIVSSGMWPARSPDLNPCDFLLWGFLKDKVYNINPRTEEELKENIANIPAKQLQRVNLNTFHRCDECLRVEGQHFQHFLRSVNKGKNFPLFRMLSAVRHADSSAKFACD